MAKRKKQVVRKTNKNQHLVHLILISVCVIIIVVLFSLFSKDLTKSTDADASQGYVGISSPDSDSVVSGIVPIETLHTGGDLATIQKVEIYAEGMASHVTDNTYPYEATWNTTTAPDGKRYVFLVVYDLAGQVVTTGGLRNINVNNNNTTVFSDVTAPYVWIGYPAGDTNIKAGSKIQLDLRIFEANPKSMAVLVNGQQYTVRGKPYCYYTSFYGTTHFNCPFTVPTKPGTVSVIQVQGEDTSGHTTVSSPIRITSIK
ncbi:MAG TPA: Ig-like domain-containing protein [Patescibacteria group bacterium]|nr:Ig-like domain-containing protein [Patescibacteria group bacterium]